MKQLLLSLLLVLLFATACVTRVKSEGEPELGDILIFASGMTTSLEDSSSFDHLTKGDWYGLIEDEGNFSLVRSYPGTYTVYIECWGDTAFGISGSGMIDMQGSVFGERRLKNYKLSEEEKVLLIGQSLEFSFEGRSYRLRAEGTVLDEGLECNWECCWDCVRDYKLYLSDGNKEQLFFEQSEFNMCRPEILFLGDIDNDGELDVLISCPSNYEQFVVELFLSIEADDDKLVGLGKEAGYDTSC